MNTKLKDCPEQDRYLTIREYIDRQKEHKQYLSDQFSDIKTMLVGQDRKIDKLRTETIPVLKLGQAKLHWKTKVLYSLIAAISGGAGASILQALSGLFG